MSALTLRPALSNDIPSIAAVTTRAFSTDPHTLMKHAAQRASPSEPMSMGDGAHYHDWLAIPEKVVVMVVEDEGEVVGSCAWGLWHYDGSKTIDKAEPIPPHDPAPNPSLPKIDQLIAITDQSLEHWQARLCPYGTRTMYILTLAVSPSHQSRGVGSLLLQWGAEKADRDGVKTWVHASEKGVRAFEKVGFGEVGALEVDLDEWSSGPPEEGQGGQEGKWGMYRFRYMIREPRGVPDSL